MSKVKKSGSISNTSKQPREKKIGEEQLLAIDEALAANDELKSKTTTRCVEGALARYQGFDQYCEACQEAFGLNFATGPKYRQLIRNANKSKRVLWCEQQLKNNELFMNIFSDECTVQLDHHGHLFSEKEATEEAKLVIFAGIMTAVRYCTILETALLPFLKDVLPDSHRYQQDYDPKHCANYT